MRRARFILKFFVSVSLINLLIPKNVLAAQEYSLEDL